VTDHAPVAMAVFDGGLRIVPASVKRLPKAPDAIPDLRPSDWKTCDRFPEDPESVKAAHPAMRERGLKPNELMGLHFDGNGEFQVSRELIENPITPMP
jgi:hypothetical protein